MPEAPTFRARMLASLVVQLLTLICISPLCVSGSPLWPVPTTQSLGTGVLWLPEKLPFTVAGRNAVSVPLIPSDHDAYRYYRRRYTRDRMLPEPSIPTASLMLLFSAPRTTSTMTPSSRPSSTPVTRSLNQTSTAQRRQSQG